jgi:hypothetical protein
VSRYLEVSTLRKLAVLTAALMAVFAMAAVAVAQSTSYNVTASTSPAKPGSKSKPVAESVKFSVSAAASGRPSTSATFKVAFGGMRSNGKSFKTCTASSINARQSDKGCSSAAKVGSGTVKTLSGASDNPTDVSVPCNLNLTIYNAGNKKAALWLNGGPGIAGAPCPITIAQAIDAKFVKAGNGEALQFSIPANLRHPVPGLNNGISQINATILKKTTKVKGKTVGYFESVACKGSRPVTLTLTSESGATSTSPGSARC